MTLEPHNLKVGIRATDSTALRLLEEMALSLGCVPTEQEVVHLLYSLKVGAPAEKGRRHYHLLYLGCDQLARSLDFDEVLTALKSSLLIMLRIQAQ